MRRQWITAAALACAGSLLVACKAHEEIFPTVQRVPTSAITAETTPPLQATPTLEPVTPTKSAAGVLRPGAPEPPPAPARSRPAQDEPKAQAAGQPPKLAAVTANPAPPSSSAAPAVAPPDAPKTAHPLAAPARDVVDPGGEIAVPPTKDGLARLGAEKCKLCHKVQFLSWAGSAHAKRTPPLDCESCHGPGSEYGKPPVMKDPAKARAAGLIKPDAAFCGRCHKRTWDPTLLGKAHAHKVTP